MRQLGVGKIFTWISLLQTFSFHFGADFRLSLAVSGTRSESQADNSRDVTKAVISPLIPVGSSLKRTMSFGSDKRGN